MMTVIWACFSPHAPCGAVSVPQSTLWAGARNGGGGCRLSPSCHHSTHNPPHEQLLVGLVVGSVMPVCHFLWPTLHLGSSSGVWGRRMHWGGSVVHLFTTFPQSHDLFTTTYGIVFGNIIWPYSSVVMLCEMVYVSLCKVSHVQSWAATFAVVVGGYHISQVLRVHSVTDCDHYLQTWACLQFSP